MFYWTCFYLMCLIDKVYCSTKYIGRENLPVEGSYIIASNHISNMDPFVLGIIERRQFAFMAKEELFRNRILGAIFRGMGAFPVKRDISDFRAIRETFRRIKLGRPLIMFPEGTRGSADREKKVGSGIGLIANKAKVPVVPVFIEGTDKVLPNGSKWFHRHQVKITIGKPVFASSKIDSQVFAGQIMKTVYQLAH